MKKILFKSVIYVLCILFVCQINIPIFADAKKNDKYDLMLESVNTGLSLIKDDFNFHYYNENSKYPLSAVKEKASEAKKYIREGLNIQDSWRNELLKTYVAIAEENIPEAKVSIENAVKSIDAVSTENGIEHAYEYYYSIIICYMALEDYDKAEYYTNIILNMPDDYDALHKVNNNKYWHTLLLTCIYIRSGQDEKADICLDILDEMKDYVFYHVTSYTTSNVWAYDNYVLSKQGKPIKEKLISVSIDNNDIGTYIPQVYIENGRVMVPLREICENLGADVEWVEESETIFIKRAESIIIMKIESKIASINGKDIIMDVAPVIKNRRTYIPLRYIGELLGEKVSWDEERLTAHVDADIGNRRETVLWFNALNANYAMRYPFRSTSQNHLETPALIYRNSTNVKYAKDYLERSYGIVDRDSLALSLLTLYSGMHNPSFLLKMMTSKQPIFIEVNDRWGNTGIAAWDLCRLAQVTCLSYHAGYITFDEYYDLTLPAAKKVQELFTSWEDMDENYLYGVAYWLLQDDINNDNKDYNFRAVAHKTALKQKFIMDLDWNQKLE